MLTKSSLMKILFLVLTAILLVTACQSEPPEENEIIIGPGGQEIPSEDFELEPTPLPTHTQFPTETPTQEPTATLPPTATTDPYEAHVANAKQFISQGDMEKATEEFDAALAIKPDSIEVYGVRGIA